MDPFEFHCWYPKGTSDVIGFGSNSYIALYGDALVLKYPSVPPGEKDLGLYDARGQAFRDQERSRALHGLFVEGEILRTLGHHPRIIRLHHQEHESGLILEYMPNGSIGSYMLRQQNAQQTGSPISLQQRLKWGRQAAEAVAYIHTKNVLHCDISIGNLLLDADLELKLADFQGKLLASDGRTVRHDGGATESAITSMPRDNTEFSSIQTDIFALGTTLFFILTGGLPFPDLDLVEDEDEIERRFRARELPRLEKHRGGEVVWGCWTGAYESAEDIVRDLQSLEVSLASQ